MTDLVDQMFPPIHRKWAPEFTDVNFWRPQVGGYDLPEDLAPPSPTLSARSDVSGQTRLSRLRNFSLLPGSGPSPATAAAAVVSAVSRTSTTTPNWHSRHTSASSSLTSEGILENERQRRLSNGSIPGMLEGFRLDDDEDGDEEDGDGEEDVDEDEDEELGEDEDEEEGEDEYEDEYEGKDEEDEYDELLATGEMDKVPFL